MSQLVEISKAKSDLEYPDIPDTEKRQSRTSLPYPIEQGNRTRVIATVKYT